MKKYVKSVQGAGKQAIKNSLESELRDELLEGFEDNLALTMAYKSKVYDADYAPGDYNPNSKEQRMCEIARARYISALADLLLADYNEEE